MWQTTNIIGILRKEYYPFGVNSLKEGLCETSPVGQDLCEKNGHRLSLGLSIEASSKSILPELHPHNSSIFICDKVRDESELDIQRSNSKVCVTSRGWEKGALQI
jgi:hypothetical protein